MQLLADLLDIGANGGDLVVEEIAGLVYRLVLLLGVDGHVRRADRFGDLLRQLRRGGDVGDLHQRGVPHRLHVERSEDGADHAAADPVDLRLRLACDAAGIERLVFQKASVANDPIGETAALQQHVLRLQELLVRGGDAEEIIDGELIRVLPLDLDLNGRPIQRLGEIAGQERSQHHHGDDGDGHLPSFVDDVPIMR